MGIPGVKMNKDHILDAINKKGPVINHIASYLECDRRTIYTWIKEDSDVAKAMEESRKEAQIVRESQEEEIKEEAYKSILDLIRNRDVPSTIFALKSKCKWEQNSETGVNYIITDKGSMDASK